VIAWRPLGQPKRKTSSRGYVRFVNVSLPEVHLTHVPVYSWFPEQFATAV
jgi:hypothetical protein